MRKNIWLMVLTVSLFAIGIRAEETATNSTPSAGHSNETVQEGFAVKGAGTLQLTFPKTWKSSTREIKQVGRPVTVIELNPGSQQDFAVMLEVASVGEDKTKDLDVKKFLEAAGSSELAHSVEKSLNIQGLKGPEIVGAYFTVTDKRYTRGMPQPGEYKYLTQGYAKLGGLVITFRIVSNRLTGEGKAAALETVRTAHLLKGS